MKRTVRWGHGSALDGAADRAKAPRIITARARAKRCVVHVVSVSSLLAGRQLERAPFAAAGAGAGVGSVFFDDTDEQIEQKLALSGRKRRQHALVCGARLRTQAPPELLSLRCEIQLTRPSVGTLNSPLNKPF